VTDTTILVAEDSLVVRAVLRRHLEGQGYSVVEAVDGDSALRACHEAKPDVVLLDIEMPGLDGYQVLAALKADPELSEVPVVFLTGRTSTEDIVEGLRLGAHDYLRKPFEASELIARVSAAVRVKTLQDELRRRNAELDLISRVDPLTALFNRRHLRECLHQVVSSAQRHGSPASVLMLDIDRFKLINDSIGHEGGDAVLCEFATRLQRVMRDEDVGGRWGGEEFLAVLPMTDLEGALAVGRRLCASVAEEPFSLREGGELKVTVSGGCAVSDLGDADDLLRRADAALYEAKAAGRNQVMAWHK
jgi:two-component system cell cycle response regulator